MTEFWKQWEGQVIAKGYSLRQYLGGCEHSAVFLAESTGRDPGGRVAVKLVRVDPDDADLQLSRWHSASKLGHPHLLRLLDMGQCEPEHAGLLYLVMEYADENLSQVLLDRPLTVDEVRATLDPALDALSYLHANGVVHAHLKPSNILAVDGELKLSSDGVTPDGGRLCGPAGTSNGRVSATTDVLALGMTIMEVLTERPEDPASIPSALPQPFDAIVQACLERDPRQRCTIAGIGEKLHPLPQPAPAPKTPEIQPAPRRRTKKEYAIAAGVAFAVLAVTGAFLYSPAKPAPQPEAVPAQAPAEVQASSRPTPMPDQVAAPAPAAAPIQTQPVTQTAPPVPVQRESVGGQTAAGKVIDQVLPAVPRAAVNTIRGRVLIQVRVEVDAKGSVTDASLVPPVGSRYFAGFTLDAARRWKFTPGMLNGEPMASRWQLRFEFRRDGTKVSAEPLRMR